MAQLSVTDQEELVGYLSKIEPGVLKASVETCSQVPPGIIQKINQLNSGYGQTTRNHNSKYLGVFENDCAVAKNLWKIGNLTNLEKIKLLHKFRTNNSFQLNPVWLAEMVDIIKKRTPEQSGGRRKSRNSKNKRRRNRTKRR